MRKILFGGLLALAIVFAAPHEVHAAVVIDIGMKDFGNGSTLLEVTAKGTFNTGGLTEVLFNYPFDAGITSDSSFILLGVGRFDGYFGLTGPASLGVSLVTASDHSSGTPFGVHGAYNRVFVPAGFVSGSEIDAESVYAQTLSGLGLTPGQYVFTAPNDKVTVNIYDVYIPSAVPELATWAMMLVGFGLVGAALRVRLHDTSLG